MRLHIHAKPKSKKAYVKCVDATHYTVAVHEAAVNGEANEAIVLALAAYFHLSRSQVDIIQGKTSRNKVVVVPLSLEQLQGPVVQERIFN